MSRRSQIRTRLVTLLSGLKLANQTANIPAFGNYTRQSDQYPYIFVGSQKTDFKMIDNSDYKVTRQFSINIVHQINPDDSNLVLLESNLDEAENLVVEALASKNSRESLIFTPTVQNPNWNDLLILSIAEPFNGSNIALTDNSVVQTILLNIEDFETYV